MPRLAADLYLEHCEKKVFAPAYNIEGIVDHPNYYKLLADFSLYDSKGNYAPHQKVEYNMPDQVPYLDENGHKRWMKSERYIKAELEKELKVRDDISAKLADKSDDGLIPRFIKAVNGEQSVEANETLEEEVQLSYTPKREEQLEEWMAQFKSGAISDEEFKRNIMNVKPKTDPLSLAHITEADVMEMANTTPDIKKKTGENNVDGERDTIISNGRSSIFNEAFKKEVETDEFIQKYATITNEDTLKTAAKELDAGGHDGVQEWLSLPPERASTVDIVKGFILLDRYQRAGNAEGALCALLFYKNLLIFLAVCDIITTECKLYLPLRGAVNEHRKKNKRTARGKAYDSKRAGGK